ncbi:hypothetical protein MJO28_017469, partial [Puccinia striiformis f. sp. tritici]
IKMKSSIGFVLLSIYLTSSPCQVVSSRIDSHLNNLSARRVGAQSSTRLVARQNVENFQKFPGKRAGVPAPTVTKQDGFFRVEFGPDNEKFTDLKLALARSCDRQSNRCADKFNKQGRDKTGDCNKQLDLCKAFVEQQVSGTGGTDPTVGGGSGGGGGGGAGQEVNLQKFIESLGGVAAPAVTKRDGVFKVEFGPADEKFTDLKQALTKSCDRQSSLCASNFSKQGLDKSGDCNKQLDRCKASVEQQVAGGGGGGGGGGQVLNLQKFTGALGGVAAPAVTKQDGFFRVEFGPPEEKFNNVKQALIRSCDRQSNLCANNFNNQGANRTKDCNDQLLSCQQFNGGQ